MPPTLANGQDVGLYVPSTPVTHRAAVPFRCSSELPLGKIQCALYLDAYFYHYFFKVLLRTLGLMWIWG